MIGTPKPVALVNTMPFKNKIGTSTCSGILAQDVLVQLVESDAKPGNA